MKILVLLGGRSSEREVSLSSGRRVADALRERGHLVTEADPAEDPFALIPLAHDHDVTWLALHGGAGEDGTIQAMFDLAGVTYTGSGHLGSALAMDKDLSKHLFRIAGVPTAAWRMVTAATPRSQWEGEAFAQEMLAALGTPVVVKPSKQGSTVGLSIVRGPRELGAAIVEAFKHDDEILLETFVPGRELTVGVLAGEALPVGEIIPTHEIYDYECKYTPGMAVEVFPADIPDTVRDEAQRHAAAACRALKVSGCARVDFRLHADGTLYCLEVNTLPGMTALSLVPQAAAAAGISFPELCERIALDAVHTRQHARGGGA